MEPMDGEDGLEAKVTPTGTLRIEEETSYITISKLPIGESTSDVPSMLREFLQPVTVKAVEMTLISAPTTEGPAAPALGSTTSKPTSSAQESVEVTFKLLTRKPGDENFTEVTIGSTEQPKVSQSKTKFLHWQLDALRDYDFVLQGASKADQLTRFPFTGDNNPCDRERIAS